GSTRRRRQPIARIEIVARIEFAPAKGGARTPGRAGGGACAPWHRDRSSFRRSAARRSRFDRDRFIASARNAPALHHGRSDPQYFKSRELFSPGGALRKI